MFFLERIFHHSFPIENMRITGKISHRIYQNIRLSEKIPGKSVTPLQSLFSFPEALVSTTAGIIYNPRQFYTHSPPLLKQNPPVMKQNIRQKKAFIAILLNSINYKENV